MNRTEDPEEKIVVAARRVFVEKGYENASMSDIAAAAGINRTALHYYFRTKDKIFQAVFGSLIGPFIPKVQDILHSDAPFFDKMDRLIDEYFEVFSQNPFLPRFVMNESGRDVRHLVEVAESIGFRTYISTLVELLETEMAAGRIRRLPVHVVFLTFIGQVMFSVPLPQPDLSHFGDRQRPGGVRRHSDRMQTDGILPDAAAFGQGQPFGRARRLSKRKGGRRDFS